LTEVISVRFRSGCKNYFFDPGGNQVKLGDQVIVETAQGPEFAICTEANHEVEDSAVVRPLCSVVRMATAADRAAAEYSRKRENEAFDICEKKIADHGLEMKLVSVSCSFDGSKIIFFFTADGRVDFRELVRDLAGVFRARIELRQIGVRDEAKMIGGLGICGRPFCCSQFLDGFLPVSIKMAKTQNLSLNPTKISGTCGRLMCCLKYEQNAYEDAAKRMPKSESFVLTPDGPGNVKSVDLLREQAKVSLDSAPEPFKCYQRCELCVLRNGKGTREGIDIPAERPARFIPEKKEDSELIPPAVGFGFGFDTAPAPEERPAAETPVPAEGDKPRRRRRSRGRRPGARTEGAAPRETDRRPAEDPARKQQEPPRPVREKKPAPPQEARRPEQDEGDAAKRRRPHHRGGRRHRGSGAGPETPNSPPKQE
jgi:cell fate regulator YaaT (PSP1 superfamily)